LFAFYWFSSRIENRQNRFSIRLKTIAFSLCFRLSGCLEPRVLLSLRQVDQAPVEPGSTVVVPVGLVGS
ncbi:hypothetical protein, partial [Pseudomonas savastanoi]|uniref:hypothetical protein n=1 Tax=Pseudomonas savastanoi TaxID=29438 RepID=UPI001C7FE8E5